METIKVKTVERTIFEMLIENTGIALCDSGGANGRAWQQNQGKKLKDFKKEPPVTYDYDGGFWTISTFHHLVNGLQLDGLCHEFNSKYVPAKDWESEDFYGVSSEGDAWLKKMGFEMDSESFNTYNEDSNLSQVLQGRWLTLGDRSYVILQVHGGADVRGGYTDARLFYVPGRQDGALFEDVYGTVTKKDGTSIDVRSDGTSGLYADDGEEVSIEKGDTVELYLSEI